MKTSEILATARAHVNNGWCQNVGTDTSGNMCALGAISWAEVAAMKQDPRVRSKLVTFPTDALMLVVREFGYESVVGFNDDPATTQQDVLNAFDKAICSLEEKGL